MTTKHPDHSPHAAHPSDESLDAHSRGELAGREARALEKHLQTCSACSDALEEYSTGVEYGRLLRDARSAIDPGLRHQLIEHAAQILHGGADRK